MPGFLGASASGGGTGGEITFPKEFVDPVTKLRVSNPETLIDTDFEYGLQPTKWETVELINNTPSFFSKSGDTTIPNIVSINTTSGSREIIVRTALEHGLSVGIPINVQGTKSLTADGSYIIGSIPDSFTFTYLAKVNQTETKSINDLYTSVITGEFFQGSQIRLSASEGIEVSTPEGASNSIITVKTESPHGFGVNTPFYFLNLNSTISQEFDSSNTTARSFDSSNSATAQTFDGSNSATQLQVNLSNDARTNPSATSTISSQDFVNNSITVSHNTENFLSAPIGQPLYYSVTSSSGYFLSNPRGILYLKQKTASNSSSTTFTVSTVPNGDELVIDSAITGTFQIADLARNFAGNNLNPETQISVNIVENSPLTFDGSGDDSVSVTVTSFSGSLVNVSTDSGFADLNWPQGRMVLYSTDGSAATGLSNNTTYWIDTIFQQGSTNNYSFTLKATPTGSTISSISGGTGTQVFSSIDVSTDKDFFYIPNHNLSIGDMLRYEYPVGGRIQATGGDADTANYFYVESLGDGNNLLVGREKGGLIILDGSSADKAAVSSAQLAEDNQTYSLGLTSGTYWVDWRGTPLQAYIDLDGSEAGSSLGGWIRFDRAFVTSNRSNIGEYLRGISYASGEYRWSATDGQMRVVRWLLPTGTRGVRHRYFEGRNDGGADGGTYFNATNFWNASNGTAVNLGSNFSHNAWSVLGATAATGVTRYSTGSTWNSATAQAGGNPRIVNTNGFTQYDDVGYDIDRLMWSHSDGTTEGFDLVQWTVWIR